MNYRPENVLSVTSKLFVPLNEIELTATLAGGPGGQHVNKVSTAIQLKFDINTSSLPDHIKERLLKLNDKRISKEGVVIIKCQEHRSQFKNRQAALMRLHDLIRKSLRTKKTRKPTKP
ncbi:MAG: aminoacyl-tRNA hydrolase, partial [Calditrichaceae bacterium]